MIGSFKTNVHAKKYVRPNLHYRVNIISLTRLHFKLSIVQQKTAKFLLCHISLHTIISVVQQIATVCNER